MRKKTYHPGAYGEHYHKMSVPLLMERHQECFDSYLQNKANMELKTDAIKDKPFSEFQSKKYEALKSKQINISYRSKMIMGIICKKLNINE